MILVIISRKEKVSFEGGSQSNAQETNTTPRNAAKSMSVSLSNVHSVPEIEGEPLKKFQFVGIASTQVCGY